MGVAFHIGWTLLIYVLLKLVNRSLSLLAAFFVLVAYTMQALTSLLYLAPLLILQGGSSLSAFTPEQLQALALVFLRLNTYAFNVDLSILRILVHPDRLPHFQVRLPASNSGSVGDDQCFGLGDLSVPAARISFVPVHRCRLRPRGNTTGAMAHREGRERSTMEGAGPRSGDAHMKAAIYSRYVD
jgi:Domain of unknown function (DUF4386)